MSIKHAGIKGVFWALGQKFGEQSIQFIVQIVLARILLPEEFGLIGLLGVFMAIGYSLMDSGMNSSLIRSKYIDEGDFSSVFVINVFVGAIVYLILFISSPFIANFFNQPQLSIIIKVYCLSFIIRSISSIQFVRLTISMDFKTQAMLRIPSMVISGLVGLLLALNGCGIWSLVFMQLTNVTVESILIWFQVDWRPMLILDWNKLKYHFNFGYKLALSGIVDTIYNNLYMIIIGKYFSVAQLGYYTRADAMKQLPVGNISTALKKVTYPLFSSIQDDNLRLKRIYKKLMQQVLYWITPILVIAGVLAEPMFRLLLTEKWLPAVPYFQLLCFVGIIHPLHAYNLNILNVKGRSDLYLRLEIFKKILTTLSLIMAVPFGIYGFLWSQLILSPLLLLINSFYSGRIIDYSIGEQLQDITPIFGLSVIVGLAVFFQDFQIPKDASYDIFRLTIGTFVGMGLYLFISLITRFEPLLDFVQIIFKNDIHNLKP